MRIEIDQSGKVEETNRSTVLALTNSHRFTLLISSKEKRKLQESFRLIGQPRLFVNYVFASLLYLLIKNANDLNNKVCIDLEYIGQTETIEKILTKLSGRQLMVEWVRVGKQSKAHDLGYKVFAGKIKPDKTVNARIIEDLINKKTGGYLNSRLKLENRYSAPVVTYIIPKKRRK